MASAPVTTLEGRNVLLAPVSMTPDATAIYIVTVSLAMLYNYLGYHSPIVDVAVYASLAITLVSGIHYVWHASRLLSQPA